MNEDILVVARDQRGLFEYLSLDFAEDPDVLVVIDRRVWQRRQRAGTAATERRRRDRRLRPPIDQKLQSFGFAIVRAALPAQEL